MAFKTAREPKDRTFEDMMWKASLVAIAAGLIVTAAIVFETKTDSYSALYLRPDSYSNLMSGDKISFTYGVQCFETGRTQYNLKVSLGDALVAGREFTIEGKGKTVEDNISFDVPSQTTLPVKVALNLTANGREYSTHFWIKGRK